MTTETDQIASVESRLRARCRATLGDPASTAAKRFDARAALGVLDGMSETEAKEWASMSDDQRALLERVRNPPAQAKAARLVGTGLECGVVDPQLVKQRLAQVGGAR